MARKKEQLGLGWLARHPLVPFTALVVLTVFVPALRIGERIKLLSFLPVAVAADSVEIEPGDLSEDERIALELKQSRESATQLTQRVKILEDALKAQNINPDFADTPLPPSIPARVLFDGDASKWRHSCWINQGREHGVEEGMPVAAGGSLVGRVYMASDDYSCVELITDPNFAASCLIIDPKDPEVAVRAVLRGDGSAMPHLPRLELEDVAPDATVKPGMLVVTNDRTGQFPMGLTIGTVREVIPQSGFLQVRIDANLDLARMDVVQVLQHKRPSIEEQALALRKRK